MKSFEERYGRKPVAGVDFDPEAPMCQDDHEYFTGTGRYAKNQGLDEALNQEQSGKKMKWSEPQRYTIERKQGETTVDFQTRVANEIQTITDRITSCHISSTACEIWYSKRIVNRLVY